LAVRTLVCRHLDSIACETGKYGEGDWKQRETYSELELRMREEGIECRGIHTLFAPAYVTGTLYSAFLVVVVVIVIGGHGRWRN